jgi:hypothetical protein
MNSSLHRFLKPNLERRGRVLRGIGALALFAGAATAIKVHWLLAIALLIAGLFVLFEALRGWCVMRACGLKTRF